MKIVIIGNGIVSLSTAYKLLKKNSSISVVIIGPNDKKGCASVAAAAMFNSFCELDSDTLVNPIEREKWLFNKAANPLWPDLLNDLEQESGIELQKGFGTFLINNQATDPLEDENFDAIVAGLKEFNEPFENIVPRDIPNYSPTAQARAGRAIYINNEGWVNPFSLTDAYKEILLKSGKVEFIDNYCKSVTLESDKISSVVLENDEKVTGDAYFLASGATFSKIIDNSNLGLKFPRVFYGVGCTVVLKTDANTLKNCIRTPNRGLACGVYSAPQTATNTVIGASNNILPYPEDFARVTSVYAMLKNAMEQINSDFFRAQLSKVTVGWRPTSEDTVPIIGSTSISNFFVATATKRDGLHCSPVISDCMSDLMLGVKPFYNLDLFKPERRPLRIYSREEAIKKTVRHKINADYQHDFIPSKNRMIEDLQKHYEYELNILHDKVGAFDWGIPPEMENIYKYGHAK